MGKTNLVRRISSLVIILSLIFQQAGFAQMAAQINLSGYLGGLKSNSAQDVFRPAHLRYFSYDNLTDNFKLLVDKGDFLKSVGTDRDLSIINAGGHDNKLKQEARELLKYFLTGVSLPDDMFWVNLRPDSQDQIIDNWLEKTDVGKIMLEADLQLKKDTAMWTSPETTIGRKYWDKLYKKAAELYGYDNITIPTLTRPWIVPGEIIVRETGDSAYVYKAVLKVMLEEDYLKNNTVGTGRDLSVNYEFKDPRAKELNKYSTQLVRELIIPKLTKEVNSSKRYAALRQVYYSLILSRWFKMRFSGKQGAYASLINSSNLTNLTSQKTWSKNTYFKQYQKSFSEGEYNIKEPVSTPTGQVIRSYFSGGIHVGARNMNINVLRGGPISSAILTIPGTVPMMGTVVKAANRDIALSDLIIIKGERAEMSTPRAGKKVSSGITLKQAESNTFDLLKTLRVMTSDELANMDDVVGTHQAQTILDDLARTHWTVKKTTDPDGEVRYYYRPVNLAVQATKGTNMVVKKELGADLAVVGHSEPREESNLSNQDVNILLKKAHQVFGGINVMAMGEPGTMRNPKGHAQEGELTTAGRAFLKAQVKEGMQELTPEQIERTMIANEPVWAIGPKAIGVATPEQAQEVNNLIRNELPSTVNKDNVIIQYGGSMNGNNAQGLMSMEDVDGGLIGGASLTKEAALKLIKKVVETVRQQKKDSTFTGRIAYLGFNFKAEIGGTKMEEEYLKDLMDIFNFIRDNLSYIDLENELRIYFAVADTEITLFDRALRGENPVDYINLRDKKLPNGMELAVTLENVSLFNPDPKVDTGAHTGQITAEALRMAGVKAVVVGTDVSNTDLRFLRAQAAGLRIIKLNNVSHITDLFSLKNQIKNGLEGQTIVITPALAREAYFLVDELKAENAGGAVGVSSAVKISEDLTKEKINQQIAELEQKFSERLKNGDQGVVQEIKQYYDGLEVNEEQIAYEYLQAHESALAADVLSAIGLPWNGVVNALVAKIRGEKEGNPRAAARQLKELATKGTCAGLTPPTQEIVSEAKRVWSENPRFDRLTNQINFPAFPALQADKPGILVFDRHGETFRSIAVLNRWSGWLNTKVTQKGLAEAYKSGESLKDIKFDKAYASALSRAQDTLTQVLLATDQTDVEILTDPAINERNYGTGGLEGWRRSEVERVFGKTVLTKWRRGYDTDEDRPFGGENLLDVQERSVPYFIENIMADIARGKTVIVSAHGNSLRAILIALRQHTDNAQVPKSDIENLEVPLSEPIVINFDNELRVVDMKGPQEVTNFFKKVNIQVQNNKVSSSMQTMPANAGAIDFGGRAMKINYEAMGSFKGVDLKLPLLSESELNRINIDSEINQIKKMVSSGISPSGRRIIELAAACEQKGKMRAYSRDLLLCVVGACGLAEINADESSLDFKTALAAIDSRI